jgi:hypothetical protein
MGQGTTIQINSLEALERLLGGDSQLEIDLRHSVVEAFARKHLKALTTLDAVSSAARQLRSEFEAQLRRDTQELVGKEISSWNDRRIELSPALKEKIRAEVTAQATEAYRNCYQEFIASHLEKAKKEALRVLEERVNVAIGVDFQVRVSTEIERRLQAIKNQI